jgi:hypothetical protein
MVFKIVFTMSNTSIKYLIQAIIIIVISFTIPLTLDSSSLLTTTTTTTALAFHIDPAGNPTISQGDVGTGKGTPAAAGATEALNYINETRKAIQGGNSTAALTNLDLAERQLSLLIGGIISPPENQTAATPSSNTSSSSSPLLSSPSTQTPSAVIVEEPSHESCNDNADNDHDGQIDEGCG